MQNSRTTSRARIQKRLAAIFADPKHGPAIVADLPAGPTAMPDWMWTFLQDLLDTPRDRSSANQANIRHPTQNRRRSLP